MITELNISNDLNTEDSYYQQIGKDQVLLHYSIKDPNPETILQAKNIIPTFDIGVNVTDPEVDVQRELHGDLKLLTDMAEFPLEDMQNLLNSSSITILEQNPEERTVKFSIIAKPNDPITEDKVQAVLEKNFNNEDFKIIDVYVPPWSEDQTTKTPPIQPETDGDTNQTRPPTTTEEVKDQFYVGRFHLDGMILDTVKALYDNVTESDLGKKIQDQIYINTPSGQPNLEIEYYEFKDDGEMYGHFVVGPYSSKDPEPKLKDLFDIYPASVEFDKFQPIGLKNEREFIGDYQVPVNPRDPISPVDNKVLKQELEEFYDNSVRVVFIRDQNQQWHGFWKF